MATSRTWLLIQQVARKEQIDMRQYSQAEIMQFYGEIKDITKAASSASQYLREALIAYAGEESDWVSPIIEVKVRTSQGRVTYDTTRMREEMGDNFMAKFAKQGRPFKTVSYKWLTVEEQRRQQVDAVLGERGAA